MQTLRKLPIVAPKAKTKMCMSRSGTIVSCHQLLFFRKKGARTIQVDRLKAEAVSFKTFSLQPKSLT